MRKQLITTLALCALCALALVACGNEGGGPGGNRRQPGDAQPPAAGGTVVHMDNTRFLPEEITIKAGEAITLQADTFVPHFIANGTWQGGQARPAREPGAPAVDNVQIDGNGSGAVGPFEQPGAFKLYCTIHPNMNLDVTVQ
jgi:plastocyanin